MGRVVQLKKRAYPIVCHVHSSEIVIQLLIQTQKRGPQKDGLFDA